MKHFYLSMIAVLLFGIAGAQSGYPGNGRDGYGGPIGKGSLQISDDGTTIKFVLTRGTTGDLNDAVVIYLHTKAGGFNTTANFTDEGDPLRKAISGVAGSDRALLNFPVSFRADYAVAFDQGASGIWELKENGSHTFINSANLTPLNNKSATDYTLTVNKADIGISMPSPGFRFIVTYVSETGYRSNEFIGDAGPVTNPQNGPYNVVSTFSYGTPLPIGFSGITAQPVKNGVQIAWSTTDADKGGTFSVERSSDGTGFYSIGTVPVHTSEGYDYTDNSPLNNSNYYRIAYTDPHGKLTYSKTVNVQVASREALKAFYNGSQIKVTMNLSNKGNYKIALINASGQAVLVKNLNYDGSMNSFTLSPEGQLNYGIYSLIVRGEHTSMSTQILVK